MAKYHTPRLSEQLFFLISGALVSSPLPGFYHQVDKYLSRLHLDGFFIIIIITSLFAPLFEEFAKAYPLFYRHGETEKSLFKLGFLTGLGFGIVEFIIYVVFKHVPFWIRLPGVLFHATNASIVAYGIGKNKVMKYYLIAVSLHLLNNLSAGLGVLWYVFVTIATLTSYGLSLYLGRQTTHRTIGFWT